MNAIDQTALHQDNHGPHWLLLQRGRDFMRAHKALKRGEPLSSMIMACIDAGLNTRDEIVRTVPKFVRCSHGHVGYWLRAHTSRTAWEGYWYRDERTKKFHLHGLVPGTAKLPSPASDVADEGDPQVLAARRDPLLGGRLAKTF